MFPRGGGGSTHIDMVDIYVPAFWSAFFADFVIAIGGFSSQMKAPNLHKLGVFCANDGKKHPILAKSGVFLYKIGILMGCKWGQN